MSAAAKFASVVCIGLLAACAHGDGWQVSAIDRTLFMCRLLSPDGPEGDLAQRDDDAWFWWQAERAAASRRLWNRRGIDALEGRIAMTTAAPDRICLQRALREAKARRIEYF